jgi:hypothetical protein
VRVGTNPDRRPSRLFRRITTYLKHSLATLVRIYALYEPFKIFWRIGGTCVVAGTAIGLRFVWYYYADEGVGHIQSLILAAILLIIGVQTILIGLVADLIGANRTLLEDTLFRVRELELRLGDGATVERLAGDASPPARERIERRGPR